MAKLLIVATAPIRMDRDVAGGEVLATITSEHDIEGIKQSMSRDPLRPGDFEIETEHSYASLLVMLHQGQAELVVGDGKAKPKPDPKKPDAKKPEPNTDGKVEPIGNAKRFVERMDEAGVTDKQIELLTEAGIVDETTLQTYFDDGTKIAGIGDGTNDKLRELLG